MALATELSKRIKQTAWCSEVAAIQKKIHRSILSFRKNLYVVHSEYAVISTSLGLRVEMLPVSSCACEVAVGLRNAEFKNVQSLFLETQEHRWNETAPKWKLKSERWHKVKLNW